MDRHLPYLQEVVKYLPSSDKGGEWEADLVLDVINCFDHLKCCVKLLFGSISRDLHTFSSSYLRPTSCKDTGAP